MADVVKPDSEKGRKQCLKRRKCQLPAFPSCPFSQNAFKKLLLQGQSNSGLCGKGLSLYNTIPTFEDPEKEAL